MYANGINVPSPSNQFYPMTVPGFQYGQTQPPYVPAPTYQPQTVNQSVTTASQSRPQGVLGHMITSPDQITPQEIPMDGSISLFPMQDGSAVIGKFWDSNGQIKTIRFIPENVEQPQQQDPFATINARFDALENLIRSQRPNHKGGYRKNNQNGSSEYGKGDQNAES